MSKFFLPLLSLLIFATASEAARVSEKAPGPDAKGKVYQWKGDAEVAYQFYIPRDYDAEKGATLTVMLHGSNLDRRWGFANHEAGKFRPSDILLSPDGTTPNGNGGFNFMGRPEDATTFTTLLDELRATLKINALYLYGHSQGSFFALYYAGIEPAAVNGVLAHASGLWTQSRLSEAGHGQALVFMHGTADPVVPYGQSVGGVHAFSEKGFPMVRLRALEGWNHWPAENNGPIAHASQQLAWIEGMTSTDPARLAEAYKVLAKPGRKEQHDFAALYQVANRLGTVAELPERARTASQATAKKVQDLANAHWAAMKLEEPTGGLTPDGSPAIGHLPMFLRAFAGVPTDNPQEKDWAALVAEHQKAASKNLGPYWQGFRGGDAKAGFEGGLNAMREGFLSVHLADPTFLKTMEKWSDDRNLNITKENLKEFKSLASNLEKSLKKGRSSFESVNKRASL